MIFAYNSGLLAFLYLYPPALINLVLSKAAVTTSFPSVLHSAITSPNGSMIMEQPFFVSSPSIPMALENTAYNALSYPLEGSHFVNHSRPFRPSNSNRKDVGSFSLFFHRARSTNPAPGRGEGVHIVTCRSEERRV